MGSAGSREPRVRQGLWLREWSAPLIENPDYKEVAAPLIPNPEYKGDWKPRKIKNEAFFVDDFPAKTLAPMGAVAVEIWTMSGGIRMDSFALLRRERGQGLCEGQLGPQA